MTALPAGLHLLDQVVTARTVVPGDLFHRPQTGAAECGAQVDAPRELPAMYAVGFGQRPCPGCWPTEAPSVTPTGMPRLRPAVPWPGNGAGYRSRLRRTDPARPTVEAGDRRC